MVQLVKRRPEFDPQSHIKQHGKVERGGWLPRIQLATLPSSLGELWV